MLCSFSLELGIDVEADGIIELPLDAPIGTDLREYLALDDNAIEISLTPNRADCLSIAGIAREIGVVNKQLVNQPHFEAVPATISDKVQIDFTSTGSLPALFITCDKERQRKSTIANVDARKIASLWYSFYRSYCRYY